MDNFVKWPKKYVWPFYNTMHERVKHRMFISNIYSSLMCMTVPKQIFNKLLN